MPNCSKCDKPVYFGSMTKRTSQDLSRSYDLIRLGLGVQLAERKTSLGKDWHAACLRCEKCNKTLTPGSHAEHDGKPYCHNPCYSALFGPGGFGRGGAESYVYKK